MVTSKVVKLEKYPSEEPNGYAVGFLIEVNNKSFYLDTVVNFDEAKDEETAVEKALDKLKSQILAIAEEIKNKPSLLGKEIYIDEQSLSKEEEIN